MILRKMVFNTIFLLFFVGVVGLFLNRKNILLLFMSIEILLLAVSCNCTFFAFYLDDVVGEIFSILILSVAAAESAIGLAILVIYYRIRGTIQVEFLNLTKG
uniref:NADH dehydrogenase subunit 4L n=1 Tax=Glaucosphaera vacuolata TaxID=38265 RepID=UPI001FCDFF2B|nr:NADH dehydrogenase subunit 4L [Glaucosphaera vacuolata]UNJ18772.1 NADH dehydrogenase subunit 4L [Glaucosphaera vacuolata]